MNGPWPSPILRRRKTPSHRHDAPLPCFGIPDDDWQRPADAVGHDLVVAAFAWPVVTAAAATLSPALS